MYDIVSCAKNTQLHSFPEFETTATQSHLSSDGSDFQFYGRNKLFLRSTKNWGLEYLRIKKVEDVDSIVNVKKIKIDYLYCVGCPKKSRDEIAVGLTTGTIRLLNSKNSQFIKKFEADKITNSVMFLDYSTCDHFLASVYDNGNINIYGLKTGAKMQTLSSDKNTTLCRFHPNRRFQLAIASYNGAVAVYDIQTKRNIFQENKSHAASCRDICMSAQHPDRLYSVGYDCIINIFDTRKQSTVQQVQSNYPFQTIAVSDCANFICVGNLKGFIYGYDLRNLKEPLNMKKVHDSTVTRVAFVPVNFEKENTNSSIETSQNQSLHGSSLSKSNKFRSNNSTPLSSNPASPAGDRLDSFTDEFNSYMHKREFFTVDNQSRLSSSSRLSTDSRLSTNLDGNNVIRLLNDMSDCNVDDVTDDASSKVDDSFVNVSRLKLRAKVPADGQDKTKKSVITKTDNLAHIREESDTEQSKLTLDEGSDEEMSILLNASNARENEEKLNVILNKMPDDKLEIPKKREMVNGAQGNIDLTHLYSVINEMRAQITSLQDQVTANHNAVLEKIFENKVDIKYSAQETRSHIHVGAFRMWRETEKQLEKLDEVTQTGFGMLLQNDPFSVQYILQQREIEDLRQKVAELTAHNSKK